ncbi:hypothetical protein TrLO_g148 [Triparma laevis f. longispina]|uniref:Uncharacterized protein n=1 Tax=Triparma laevis f. longispina TaxID=1714387 RepID=A0A9W7C7F5_9STRA|nr:hypothetical protein TrLO_g148 [Triparma laevis f. longispina]
MNETTPLNPDAARSAYDIGDLEASKTFHDGRSGGQAIEEHSSGGDFIKAIVFGGLDGILTSFAIVAGAAGGGMTPQVVLVLGFSNIFADALSMGVGEFLSSKAHNEWVLSERAREKWELDNYPEGEIQEMIDIYVDRGMSKEDATIVITKMSKYSEFFVDVMMAEELQLQVPEDDHKCESMKEGLVMFLSFAAFGSLPIMGYVIIPIFFPEWGEETLFSTACAVTGIVLFMMGCVKSMFSTTNWFVSGMETFMLGGACATLAYVIGQYVEEKTGAKVRNCKERRDELATC